MAKYEAFRVYSKGFTGDKPSEREYFFSIIAGPNQVEYVIPADSYDLWGTTFDNDRIKMVMSGIPEEQLPTTPTEWAILALDNTNFYMMPSHDDSDDYLFLLEEEQAYADSVAGRLREIYGGV